MSPSVPKFDDFTPKAAGGGIPKFDDFTPKAAPAPYDASKRGAKAKGSPAGLDDSFMGTISKDWAGIPEGVYNAVTHPIDTVKGAVHQLANLPGDVMTDISQGNWGKLAAKFAELAVPAMSSEKGIAAAGKAGTAMKGAAEGFGEGLAAAPPSKIGAGVGGAAGTYVGHQVAGLPGGIAGGATGAAVGSKVTAVPSALKAAVEKAKLRVQQAEQPPRPAPAWKQTEAAPVPETPAPVQGPAPGLPSGRIPGNLRSPAPSTPVEPASPVPVVQAPSSAATPSAAPPTTTGLSAFRDASARNGETVAASKAKLNGKGNAAQIAQQLKDEMERSGTAPTVDSPVAAEPASPAPGPRPPTPAVQPMSLKQVDASMKAKKPAPVEPSQSQYDANGERKSPEMIVQERIAGARNARVDSMVGHLNKSGAEAADLPPHTDSFWKSLAELDGKPRPSETTVAQVVAEMKKRQGVKVNGAAKVEAAAEPVTAFRSSQKPGASPELNDQGILYTTPDEAYSKNWGPHTQRLSIAPKKTLDLTRFAHDEGIEAATMKTTLEQGGVTVSKDLMKRFHAAEASGGEALQYFGQFGGKPLVDALKKAGYDSAKINEYVGDTGAKSTSTLLFDAALAKKK